MKPPVQDWTARIAERDLEIDKLRYALAESGIAGKQYEAEFARLRSRIQELERAVADFEVLRGKLRESEEAVNSWRAAAAERDKQLAASEARAGSLAQTLAEWEARGRAKDEVIQQLRVALATPVPPPPAPAPAEAASTQTPPDDLKRIKGVGPALEQLLHKLGIQQFRQIASWKEEQIDEIDSKLGRFKGRIRRDSWIELARQEHLKKYDEQL